MATQASTLSGETARFAGGLHPLGQGVTAWLTPNGGWGESNAGLVCGKGASLLVDTLWDLQQTGDMLGALAPQLQNAPIQKLVNTHGDGDHWFGNQLVGAAEMIATKAAVRGMKENGPGKMRLLPAIAQVFRCLSYAPVPNRGDWRTAADYLDAMLQPFDFTNIVAMPADLPFSGKLQIEVGGREVRLIEMGPAHTAGDLVVHVPDAKIVFAGDILFHGVTPVLWDGSARNWIKACERIMELKPEIVVPGHGPVGDLEAVDGIRKYWQFLRSAVRRHFEKGRPVYVTAAFIAQSDEFLSQPFAHWAGQERIVINVYSIYRRLMGKKRTIPTWERLKLLKQAAVLAGEIREG